MQPINEITERTINQTINTVIEQLMNTHTTWTSDCEKWSGINQQINQQINQLSADLTNEQSCTARCVVLHGAPDSWITAEWNVCCLLQALLL
jgi:hypothetical protein